MVAEADESDRSFLMLWPSIAVMTNIDHEHMESYGSFEELQQAFADFANKVPFYGSVVACADDPHLAPVLPRITRRVVTYGLDAPRAPTVGVAGRDVELGALRRPLLVHRRAATARRRRSACSSSPVPGRHNLQNALAAVAVAGELGIDFAQRRRGAARFHGAERRFERHGEAGGVLVVDDYGHHPTEIAAVLAAARATLGRRLVVAFQPHRYSRTQQLMRRVRAGARGRRRDRADRHLRRRRGADSRRHGRGAGRARFAAAPAGRCAWSGSSTTSCRELLTLRQAGRRGDHARRRLDWHGAEAARSRRCAQREARALMAGVRSRRQALPPRARVSPARKRGGCASSRTRVRVPSPWWLARVCARLPRASVCVLTTEALTVTRITVERQRADVARRGAVAARRAARARTW